MEHSRRDFLRRLAAPGGLLHINTSARPAALGPINRAALVRRHDPVLRQAGLASPLAVGNGGLADAVATMAAGWHGATASHAPGFPSDGSWTVRLEGLNFKLMREI